MKFATSLIGSDGKPRLPSAASQRQTFNRFMETGSSGMHSTAGMTLAPLLNELVAKEIPFTLHFQPGGYFVEKAK